MANNNVQITFTARSGEAIAAFKQVATELKGINPAITQVNSNFGKMQGATLSLSGAVKGLAAAFAVWKAIDIGRDIVNTGMQMQQLENKMKAATASNEVAADSMKYLRSESKRLGLDFVAAADGFSSFAAAALRSGLTLDQTKQIFTGVSEAAAAMGLSAERQQLVFQALAQMASKGTVSMEELRQQLGESLPGALQIFASSMGVSTAKFMEMVAAGEVLVPDLVKMGDEMHRQFGQRAVDASKSATGEFNRFNNALRDLKVEFMDAGPMDTFTQVLRQLTELLSDPEFIEGLKNFAALLADITSAALKAAAAVGNFFAQASQRKKDILEITEEAKANGEWFISNSEMQERLEAKQRARAAIKGLGNSLGKPQMDASGGLLAGSADYQASGGLLGGPGAGRGDGAASGGGLGGYTLGTISKPTGKGSGGKDKSRVSEWDADLNHMLLSQQVFLDDAKQKELAYWQNILQNQKLSAEERAQVERKVYNLQSQMRQNQTQQEQEANRKRLADLRRLEQTYYQVSLSIMSSFNNSIRGMITGTTSFRQAFSNMMLELLMKFIQMGQMMLARWIAVEVAKTAATTTAEGTRGAVQTAYQSKSIFASAKTTFAGVYANLSPVMGPFAAIPATAAAGVVLAAGAALPSFDKGAYELPGDMIAQVHKGETILNATEASKFRTVMDKLGNGGSMGGGYSPNINISVSAVDGPSVARMLKKQKGTIAGIVASAGRDFNHKLPAMAGA